MGGRIFRKILYPQYGHLIPSIDASWSDVMMAPHCTHLYRTPRLSLSSLTVNHPEIGP